MAGEQVLEREGRSRTCAACARRRRRSRRSRRSGSTTSIEITSVAGVAEAARPAATSRRCRSARRPASTGTTPGRRDRRRRAACSSSLSLSMLMPGPTVTVRSTRSISWIWFISLTSTRIPPRSGTAPSDRPVPPARGTTGMPQPVGELDDLRDLLGGAREHRHVGHVLGPAVDGERRRDARAVHARAEMSVSTRSASPMIARSSATTRVVDGALERDAHGRASAGVRVPADLDPRRLRDQLEEVDHLEGCSAAAPGGGQRPLGPRAGADQRVDLELPAARATRRRLISAVISGFSIGSPPPPPEQ